MAMKDTPEMYYFKDKMPENGKLILVHTMLGDHWFCTVGNFDAEHMNIFNEYGMFKLSVKESDQWAYPIMESVVQSQKINSTDRYRYEKIGNNSSNYGYSGNFWGE